MAGSGGVSGWLFALEIGSTNQYARMSTGQLARAAPAAQAIQRGCIEESSLPKLSVEPFIQAHVNVQFVHGQNCPAWYGHDQN